MTRRRLLPGRRHGGAADAISRPSARAPARDIGRRRIETDDGSESAIQRTVFQHLGWRGTPGTFAFHPANGGARRRIEAAILSGLGVVAGVPDLVIIKGGQVFALELKKTGGRLSAAQRATHATMRAAGAVVGTAVGLDEALAWLEAHGLLLGTSGPGRATGLAGARSCAPVSRCPEPISAHGRPAPQAGGVKFRGARR